MAVAGSPLNAENSATLHDVQGDAVRIATADFASCVHDGSLARRRNPDPATKTYVEICLDCGGWRVRQLSERGDDGTWGPPGWGSRRPGLGSTQRPVDTGPPQ